MLFKEWVGRVIEIEDQRLKKDIEFEKLDINPPKGFG